MVRVRLVRRPRRPALFWTIFGLVAVIAASSVTFLAVYS